MKRIQSTLLVLALLFFISNSGCQASRFGQPNTQYGGQPYAQNAYGPAGVGQPYGGGPSLQGFQNFGQDLGRRFSNGFLNRAVNGVVNLAWRAVGL